MKLHLPILFSIYAFIYCSDNNNSGQSVYQLITSALMANYDRINRPASNLSDAVSIQLNPSLFSILEVNIAKQTLSLKQWLNMYWYDPNLKWNPAMYAGIDSIMLQRSTIWLPDIVIAGQISVSALSDKLSLAQISSDGHVAISSDQVATVACQYDIVDFPYDTQNCTIHYFSWMYNSTQIILLPMDPPDLSVYNENDEWTMKSYTTRMQTSTMSSGNTYTDVYYDIKITRKPSYYITTFIWPTFLITILAIIGIFSPFNESGEREEKVTMGLTTLLTMAVILMIVTGDMPKSSNGIPLLGLFILLEIGIASLASIFSVLIIWLHRNWMNGTPIPRWLLRLTCLAKKKGKKALKLNENESNMKTQAWQNKENTEQNTKRDPKLFVTVEKEGEKRKLRIESVKEHYELLREEWGQVAHRLDLILMAIFLMANIIICVVVLEIGNSKLYN